jgi:hypothetical protein
MLFISLFNYTLKIHNLKNSRQFLEVKSNVKMQELKCLFILDYNYTNTYILILHVFYFHLNFIPYSFPKVLPFSPKGRLREVLHLHIGTYTSGSFQILNFFFFVMGQSKWLNITLEKKNQEASHIINKTNKVLHSYHTYLFFNTWTLESTLNTSILNIY